MYYCSATRGFQPESRFDAPANRENDPRRQRISRLGRDLGRHKNVGQSVKIFRLAGQDTEFLRQAGERW
jgi:hypothetical protein